MHWCLVLIGEAWPFFIMVSLPLIGVNGKDVPAGTCVCPIVWPRKVQQNRIIKLVNLITSLSAEINNVLKCLPVAEKGLTVAVWPLNKPPVVGAVRRFCCPNIVDDCGDPKVLPKVALGWLKPPPPNKDVDTCGCCWGWPKTLVLVVVFGNAPPPTTKIIPSILPSKIWNSQLNQKIKTYQRWECYSQNFHHQTFYVLVFSCYYFIVKITRQILN